jgi:hypothetical protein
VPAATVSIVLEWENVLLAKSSRARRLLEVLPAEVQAAVDEGVAAAPVEVVVSFDADEFGDSPLVADLEEALAGAGPIIRLRTVSSRSGDYYELKNDGARDATGDFLVFLDSDVIPEPGWLVSLLGPLHDEDVGLVAGNTYLEPVGLYGKAFALAWFFPLRATTTTVLRQFWANNVRNSGRVDLRRVALPAAIGISTSYYLACSAGEVATMVSPGFMTRHFRI